MPDLLIRALLSGPLAGSHLFFWCVFSEIRDASPVALPPFIGPIEPAPDGRQNNNGVSISRNRKKIFSSLLVPEQFIRL